MRKLFNKAMQKGRNLLYKAQNALFLKAFQGIAMPRNDALHLNLMADLHRGGGGAIRPVGGSQAGLVPAKIPN